MFRTFKQKIVLGLYVFLVISIPVGAYLASQRQILKSSAQPENSITPIIPSKTPGGSPKSTIPSPTPKSSPLSPDVPISIGPVLNFTLVLEGRPKNNQAAQIFVGIAQGDITIKPNYLLSFTIDIPESGTFTNLSLAGLNQGVKYTAYIKGPAQIATASAFIMSPATTNLNGGLPLTLLTGDLNDDNSINASDYSIAKTAYGTTTSSKNWNSNVDFNLDGKINVTDLGFITKNFGKVGSSGIWTSPPPSTPSGTPTGGSGGYWFWMPEI